jgi:uncharacterized protein (TIRG00374 family)
MSAWLKTAIKYSISFLLGGFLLWYVYKDTNFDTLILNIKGANYTWVTISYIFAVISHIARAYRWKLLLEPLGLDPGLKNSFIATMVGYLANTILPRMGEVSRCAVLKKTNDIPVNKSFGTVITERFIDLIALIILLSTVLCVEIDRLSIFVFDILGSKLEATNKSKSILLALGSLALIAAFLFMLTKYLSKKLSGIKLYQNAKIFLNGLLEGLLSIKKLKKKKQFILSTIAIWLCYFLMAYVMFFALPETSFLGIKAGLAVLVLGGIGMAAPSPGGMGSYHWIIMHGLVLYGLSAEQGLLFATLVHSSQMIMLIVFGLISLFATFLISKGTTSKVQ